MMASMIAWGRGWVARRESGSAWERRGREAVQNRTMPCNPRDSVIINATIQAKLSGFARFMMQTFRYDKQDSRLGKNGVVDLLPEIHNDGLRNAAAPNPNRWRGWCEEN